MPQIRWWPISNWFQQALLVEPGRQLQRFSFQSLYSFPWPFLVDQLGLVESVDGLRQGVVVAVADIANRRFDTGFTQPLAVAN